MPTAMTISSYKYECPSVTVKTIAQHEELLKPRQVLLGEMKSSPTIPV